MAMNIDLYLYFIFVSNGMFHKIWEWQKSNRLAFWSIFGGVILGGILASIFLTFIAGIIYLLIVIIIFALIESLMGSKESYRSPVYPYWSSRCPHHSTATGMHHHHDIPKRREKIVPGHPPSVA